MDRARREGRKDDSKTPGGDGWREEERATSRASTTPGATAPPLHHGLGQSIARRLTEERWRKRGEKERTTEGQGDGWGKQLSAWSLRESDRTMEERRV